MLLQMRVPTSMTDWCISAFTRSSSRSLPLLSISVAMCERRSRVSGSTVWYSSSIPRVKVGRICCSLLALFGDFVGLFHSLLCSFLYDLFCDLTRGLLWG